LIELRGNSLFHRKVFTVKSLDFLDHFIQFVFSSSTELHYAGCQSQASYLVVMSRRRRREEERKYYMRLEPILRIAASEFDKIGYSKLTAAGESGWWYILQSPEAIFSFSRSLFANHILDSSKPFTGAE